MSPENKEATVKVIVKKDEAYRKADHYAKTKDWGPATGKRLSFTGYWRK